MRTRINGGKNGLTSDGFVPIMCLNLQEGLQRRMNIQVAYNNLELAFTGGKTEEITAALKKLVEIYGGSAKFSLDIGISPRTYNRYIAGSKLGALKNRLPRISALVQRLNVVRIQGGFRPSLAKFIFAIESGVGIEIPQSSYSACDDLRNTLFPPPGVSEE